MSYYGGDPSSSSGGGYYGSNNTGYSAANVQAWQANAQQQQQQQQQQYGSQQQQSQQQGYSQQQQQQQQQQPAGVWNPAAVATMANVAGSMMSGDNDAVFMAGQKFFQQGTARMIPGLESSVLLLRNYFAVDNRYVLRKMQKVLFPFLSKQWQRQVC